MPLPKYWKSTLITLCLLALCACSPAINPEANPSLTVETQATTLTPTRLLASPSPTSEPSPIPSPSPQPTPHSQYTLEAILDYEQRLLQVEEKIDYTNTSSEILTEMVLVVDPLYYPGTFDLIGMDWDDGVKIDNIQSERGWLRFPFRQPLEPGEAVTLRIQYQLNLPTPDPSPTTRPVPFGHTERQTNLVDWYPFVPPYLPDQGWLIHPAGYYGEHLAYEIANFNVSIRLSKPNPNLTIAASSPAVQDGEWHRYQHNLARNFVWSISPYYQILKSQAGPVQVTSYAYAGQDQANQAVLDTTVKALELYSRLFGEYPRSALSIVEADFLDGMEYDGLYFLSKGFYNLYTGTPGEYLIAIAAHETAHQWWYALVGNDQALEPWLDEALSTYSEHLYYENYFPEALEWWWNYRINYYQPSGKIDISIYNPQGADQPYRAYRDAVYLNGAIFFHDLRNKIGNEAFFDFINSYAKQTRYQHSTTTRFFSILDQFTQENLSELIEKYFSTID